MPKNKISKKRINAIVHNIQIDIHEMRQKVCQPYIKHRHENNPKLMKELENKLNENLEKILENSNYDFLIIKKSFGHFEIYMGDNGEWIVKLLPPEETKDEN